MWILEELQETSRTAHEECCSETTRTAHQFREESMAQSSTRFSVHSSAPCWHSRPRLVFFALP